MENKLHSLLDNIENKLQLNSTRKSFNGSIKQNLQYFSPDRTREMAYREHSLRDQFIRTSAESSSYHNLYDTDPVIVTNNALEIRKIIERELNPYISNFKSELKLSLDHFHKEVDCYNACIPEIKALKDAIECNRNLITSANEATDRKLNEHRDTIFQINRIHLEIKAQYDEIKGRMEMIDSNNDKLYAKLYDYDQMKINYDNFHSKLKEYYNKVETDIQAGYNAKIEENRKGIDDIKKNYDFIMNSIARAEAEELRIGNQMKELQERMMKLYYGNSNTSNRYSTGNNEVGGGNVNMNMASYALLKNNQDVKTSLDYINKKLAELNGTVSIFSKDLAVLKEHKSHLPLPYNVPHTKDKIDHLLPNTEIVNRLYIMEEMLNEHHKMLQHHNTKYVTPSINHINRDLLSNQFSTNNLLNTSSSYLFNQPDRNKSFTFANESLNRSNI